LHQQDHRDPLVVRDHRTVLLLLRNILLIREVVGVADPTVVVGVLFVVAREVGWHPALDGLAYILLRGDHEEKRTKSAVE